ncbi:MAG: hypothetical protein ACLSCV_02345 [Acutalibacteraceae bacterium]
MTYLPRMLPLVLFRKTIENQFIKSFWHMCLCVTWRYDISGHSVFHIAGRRFFAVYFLGGLVGMLAAMILAYFNRVTVGGKSVQSLAFIYYKSYWALLCKKS